MQLMSERCGSETHIIYIQSLCSSLLCYIHYQWGLYVYLLFTQVPICFKYLMFFISNGFCTYKVNHVFNRSASFNVSPNIHQLFPFLFFFCFIFFSYTIARKSKQFCIVIVRVDEPFLCY